MRIRRRDDDTGLTDIECQGSDELCVPILVTQKGYMQWYRLLVVHNVDTSALIRLDFLLPERQEMYPLHVYDVVSFFLPGQRPSWPPTSNDPPVL